MVVVANQLGRFFIRTEGVNHYSGTNYVDGVEGGAGYEKRRPTLNCDGVGGYLMEVGLTK